MESSILTQYKLRPRPMNQALQKSGDASVKEKAKEHSKDQVKEALPTLDPFKALPTTPSAPPSKVKTHKREADLKETPALIFMGGASFLGVLGGDDGLAALAEKYKESKLFSFANSDDALAEIKKHSPSAPLVIVGAGLGGDSAVELSNKLRTLDNGFRRVDLLITLNALGAKNDIIPENVEKHQNFISDTLLGDAAHIARDENTTQVENFLIESRGALSDNEKVQMKVMKAIDSLVRKNKHIDLRA